MIFSLQKTKATDEFVLTDFAETLAKAAQKYEMSEIATIRFNDDTTGSNVVSSIDFDRDLEFFAVARVHKRVKIFGYRNVVEQKDVIHFPVHEIHNNSKLR